jgi:hypothetical protein
VQGWRRSPFQAKVYNFDVQGLQCYAVGRGGVLVHNTNGEPIEMHHSDPAFMGGADPPTQELTPMWQSEHQQLHQELNEFLEQYDDGFGHNMRPGPGNSGEDIQAYHGRPALLQAMADFYNTFWDQWPDAAADFFKQWPQLDRRG